MDADQKILQRRLQAENKIMAKVYGAVDIDRERCKGCGLCVAACPCDVLSLQTREVNDRGYLYAYARNQSVCIGCAACSAVSPDAFK